MKEINWYTIDESFDSFEETKNGARNFLTSFNLNKKPLYINYMVAFCWHREKKYNKIIIIQYI